MPPAHPPTHPPIIPQVNHSANARAQTALAAEAVATGRIGVVEHVTAFMGSALMWLFDDVAQVPWHRVA